MKQDLITPNIALAGKVLNLLDSIKHSKGVAIVGPRCSGKTTIVKYLGILMKHLQPQIEMKISVLNPDVYPIDQLYGSADSGVMSPEMAVSRDNRVRIASITSSVLKIALQGFKVFHSSESDQQADDQNDEERPLQDSSDEENKQEANPDQPRLLKTLLFE